MPDFQPTLIGETVVVRPITLADWPETFKTASDPKIWELHPASDRYQELVFRRFFDDAIASKMAFVFVDRPSGAIIGSSRYHGYDPDLSEIEIGWTFLARSHWGGRTNAEIKLLMIDHAFTMVDTAIFWVGETNLRSRRAMEKIGGILRPGVYYRPLGGDRPSVIFEIRKP